MSWPTVALGKVADLCLGKMLDAQKNKGKPYPYLRNPNVKWMKVDLSGLKQMLFEDHELDRYGLRSGDVLICEGGEAGRAAIWDGSIPEMKFQKAIHRVRVGPDLHNRYLVHKLRHDYHHGGLTDYYTGTTIKHLTGQDLARYRLPLPPLAEQRRIAAILDAADALRQKRRQALRLLDQLSQAIFIEMFGDLILNERGWPAASVSDFVSGFESGKNLVADDEEDDDAPYRVLKVSAVTSLAYRPEESKPLPRDYVPPPSHMVREGDLLFSRANTTELIGATALVNETPANCVLPDKIWRFVWHDRPRADPYFVWYVFQQHRFRDQISRRATGTSGSMKNISQEKVLSIPVALPPLELQQEFASRGSLVSKQRRTYETGVDKNDRLFASLQHRAFRGEL